MYVISLIIGIYCSYFTVYIRVAAYSLLQSLCILCLRSMCYIGCTGYYVVRFFVNVGTTFHTAGEDVTRYIYLSCPQVLYM